MKHVAPLTTEPEGLAAWRTEHPDDVQATGLEAKGAWNRFRDSGGDLAERWIHEHAHALNFA
jgi:hypothetical protein